MAFSEFMLLSRKERRERAKQREMELVTRALQKKREKEEKLRLAALERVRKEEERKRREEMERENPALREARLRKEAEEAKRAAEEKRRRREEREKRRQQKERERILRKRQEQEMARLKAEQEEAARVAAEKAAKRERKARKRARKEERRIKQEALRELKKEARKKRKKEEAEQAAVEAEEKARMETITKYLQLQEEAKAVLMKEIQAEDEQKQEKLKELRGKLEALLGAVPPADRQRLVDRALSNHNVISSQLTPQQIMDVQVASLRAVLVAASAAQELKSGDMPSSANGGRGGAALGKNLQGSGSGSSNSDGKGSRVSHAAEQAQRLEVAMQRMTAEQRDTFLQYRADLRAKGKGVDIDNVPPHILPKHLVPPPSGASGAAVGTPAATAPPSMPFGVPPTHIGGVPMGMPMGPPHAMMMVGFPEMMGGRQGLLPLPAGCMRMGSTNGGVPPHVLAAQRAAAIAASQRSMQEQQRIMALQQEAHERVARAQLASSSALTASAAQAPTATPGRKSRWGAKGAVTGAATSVEAQIRAAQASLKASLAQQQLQQNK